MKLSQFLAERPIVFRKSSTHYAIRRLVSPESLCFGAYLVWPDGRTNTSTEPLYICPTLDSAVELAKR